LLALASKSQLTVRTDIDHPLLNQLTSPFEYAIGKKAKLLEKKAIK
jgi:hypothetical protein